MAELRCLVAVCCNSLTIFRQTAQSLMELGWGDRVQRAKDDNGFAEVSFHWDVGFPRVDALRDSSAELAMAEGFSHILFLDADMVWPSDVLTRLLAHHDKGIVGGLYTTKAAPYSPVALKDKFRKDGSCVDMFYHVTEYDRELIEVDVLGMGCTLIPTAVFTALGKRPWFEYRDDDKGWPAVTEDVPFCLHAKEAGFRLFLDPAIKCGHVTTQVIDERWGRRYRDSIAASGDKMKIRLTRGDSVAEASLMG